MTNKRQVFLSSLHQRDALSLSEGRQQFGHAAYHWEGKGGSYFSQELKGVGLLCFRLNRVNLNSENNWLCREKANVKPEKSGHFLGRIMIGQGAK
ncbi:hypothetical protein NUU61_000193 [Penicillium alfredii]|uniref:Uncharacterized protein n=1 Tax=Penicillium alfredii TaxID=1506179 RepID=A0A9W9KPI2_9EURO|nr:uncharacterized protein NUU61_000193 [Penicillium alfredii]KAJ5114434.1 hypothetical protein NUU61_000193 [Penicillium alfredii]